VASECPKCAEKRRQKQIELKRETIAHLDKFLSEENVAAIFGDVRMTMERGQFSRPYDAIHDISWYVAQHAMGIFPWPSANMGRRMLSDVRQVQNEVRKRLEKIAEAKPGLLGQVLD
jgi:hypothetical protein